MARSSRKSDTSVIRVGLLVGAFGVFVIVAGYLIYSFEQMTYRQPLEVDPPQGATLIAQETLSEGARRLFYESSQTPEEVVQYFNEKMREYMSPDDYISCQRTPRSPENYPNYRAGNGVIPYQFLCSIDRATVGSNQTTTIVVHPGVRNDATGENFEGKTRIEYEQVWEP